MYQDTITLFNFHTATGKWYTTVILGTDIGESRSAENTTSGKNNADTVSVIIHCSTDKAVTDIDGAKKKYLGTKEFARCENPAECFTFNPECDFLYSDKWTGNSEIRDDDYESGLYHYMNDRYDGVYKITSSSFYGLLPHFEVGGR